MKKRFFTLALALALILSLSSCGSSDSPASSSNENVTVIEAPSKETEAPTVPLSDSGELGQLEVSIGDLEHIQDYDGNPAILIHFTFTNNSEENQSAMFSLAYKAFQNGIGLEDAFIMDESIHSSDDLMKEIQPGTTIELTKAYALSSDTAPVEFYVSEAISFDDAKLGKIFEIATGGTTVFSVAPGLESATEIGDYLVSINSYDIAEDYDGNPALVLNMGYTNNSNVDSPFYVALEVKAFQDGIELEKAYFVDNTVVDDSGNYLNVLPGAGLGVAEAFILTSDTSPVDIEIAEFFSFNDEKITTQINLTE